MKPSTKFNAEEYWSCVKTNQEANLDLQKQKSKLDKYKTEIINNKKNVVQFLKTLTTNNDILQNNKEEISKKQEIANKTLNIIAEFTELLKQNAERIKECNVLGNQIKQKDKDFMLNLIESDGDYDEALQGLKNMCNAFLSTKKTKSPSTISPLNESKATLSRTSSKDSRQALQSPNKSEKVSPFTLNNASRKKSNEDSYSNISILSTHDGKVLPPINDSCLYIPFNSNPKTDGKPQTPFKKSSDNKPEEISDENHYVDSKFSKSCCRCC